MTLYRQLLIWMFIVFTLLLLTSFTIEFRATRDFLQQQQAVNLSNTIHATGLALSPYLQEEDTLASESIINALFDSGFYSQVTLTHLRNDAIFERQYPINIEGVPQWFINLDLFHPLTLKQTITSGWLQLADLEITDHPGVAYRELWQASRQLLMGFSIAFAVTLLILTLVLRHILTPLNGIVEKTKAIAKNQFGAPLPLPSTQDLKEVVVAMNKMESKLELHFEQQVEESQRLRERAYIDSASGLGNRSYFSAQVDAWQSESGRGGLGILHVYPLVTQYDIDFQLGDQVCFDFANQLSTHTAHLGVTLARISQFEFALLYPNASREDLEQCAEILMCCANSLIADPLAMSVQAAALGMVWIEHASDSTQLLAQADNALSQAKLQTDHPVVIVGEQNTETLGKQQWRSLILEAIANDNIHFQYQQVSNEAGVAIQKELFSAIHKGKQRYPASHFLGVLEHFKMGDSFDRFVIEKVLRQLSSQPSDVPIAINLTPSSMTNAAFIRWLSSIFQRHAKAAQSLMLELPENTVIQYPEHTALLCDVLTQHKVAFGIDQYGRNFRALDYLQQIHPSYVKIDYAYTHHLDDDIQRDVLAAICRTAQNLSIQTIATRVETQAQLEQLQKLYISGFQGFVLDKTEEMNHDS